MFKNKFKKTSDAEIANKIKRIKKKKNAVILAHFYQINEIQDIADYIGDSLGLSQKASETNADLIVFAGVKFMAETAKILNPDKKVVLPDLKAGCSLADSCSYDDFKKFREKYPDHIVISYINCSLEIKTISDIICTSGNAVKLVESFQKCQKIIFAPDKNLGGYINRITGRNMILWDGTCDVHDRISTETINNLKKNNSDAKLVAHPECNEKVLELADFIGSTTQMLKFTKTDSSKKYIVATETGILHKMRKESPKKEFLIVSDDEKYCYNDCTGMKLNTMEKLYLCMKNEKPEIILSEDIISKAKVPIEKMIDISKRLVLI